LLIRKYHIAIVGATGLVGQEFIKILEKRDFPMASVHLFASNKSTGKKLFINHREAELKELTRNSFDPVDIVFFAAGSEISQHFIPRAVKRAATAIDCSGVFGMDEGVPLVVPEVNPQDLENHHGLIASPNSTTVQLVVALYPLHRVNPIKRIVVDTYQAVSETGSTAVDELNNQIKLVLEGKSGVPHVFPHQIAFNVLPEVDVFWDDGYTKEEWKLSEETRKIFHDDTIAISATCVRVPVIVGNGEAIHVEFSRPMSPEEARTVLVGAPGVKVLDDPSVSLYPYPWSAVGSDDVFVGRIRRDVSHPNGLVMWVVADNLRKGVALNAIQIAEQLISKGLV
jgi:aspartate-semialdehyde dehydrogenase